MINRDVLREALEGACQIHRRVFSEALLECWQKCTESVSTKQFQEVFYTVCGGGFPKPSEFLQAVAGVNPTDDWEAIMEVAQGRSLSAEISGIGAIALCKIGGLRAIAQAKTETGSSGWSEIGRLKKDFVEKCEIGAPGSLLPSREVISLAPCNSPKASVDTFSPDYTGESRANALIRLLESGNIKPALAIQLATSGHSAITGSGGGLPAAQRDRVLAAIQDIQRVPKLEVVQAPNVVSILSTEGLEAI